jgi:multiple sugar transport system ATP-binding protein
MIYVTHDQVEAMTLADRIVVLDFGTIAQVGTPRELYESPANLFVAEFIGSPKMNILPCTVAAGNTISMAGAGALRRAATGRSSWASGPRPSSFAPRARAISTGSWTSWNTLAPTSS